MKRQVERRYQPLVRVGLVGFGLVACAKANDTNLLARPDSNGGAGGRGGTSAAGATGGTSPGSGGASGKGGSSGRGGAAGRGGAGGTSAGAGTTGGTGASGGAGAGDRGGGAGTGVAASAGRGSDGGAAGEDGIPPDVLARAKVVLHYAVKPDATAAMSRTVEMRMFLENKATEPLELSAVTIRYWMTSEPSAAPPLNCYYAAPTPKENVRLRYVDDGDESHVEIKFTAGRIAGPTHDLNATEVQLKVDAPTNTTFDQSDDHSFAPEMLEDQPAAPHDEITVYVADRLVWGCEPSGVCPDSGEGGAGGQAGEGGRGGEAGEPSAGGANEGGQGGQGGQGGEPGAVAGDGGGGAAGDAAGAAG